ncbi:MAG TPA: hypothetical protein VLV78_18815 [Thermoanaerobaculia bacterium]|nr:hypothetical protein [Thermoanaerobaculia bacterium]
MIESIVEVSRRAPARNSRPRSNDNDPHTVVLTAIEGTLEPLLARGVRAVPFTSMTLAEIEPILRVLGIAGPVIIEGGGGIGRRRRRGWMVEPCGISADASLDVIREIEDRSGASLLVYSVASECETMRCAAQRRFSEPFVIESGDLEEIREAASSIGFSVRRGPRFFHLTRRSDEGRAVRRVREDLRCDLTFGVGATPLDAEFLTRVEIPVIIPGVANAPDPELIAEVPGARIGLDDVWPLIVTRACS